MDISNPRRILLLSPPNSGVLDLLKDLTGTAPTPATASLAGLSHTLSLKTAYYTAEVPVWLDEPSLSSPSEWSADFLMPEAREVLSALGAFVIAFRKPMDEAEFVQIQGLIKEVSKVVKQCGYGWDGVCLAIGMKQDIVPNLEVPGDKWEEVLEGIDGGWEWIDAEAKGRNEYNEPVGIARSKEALEANDWAGNDDDDLDLDGLEDGDEDDAGLSLEATELEMEMFGMKQAIYGGGDYDTDEDEKVGKDGGLENDEKDKGKDDEEEGVEQLEAMMLKMQAMRDMGSDLPEAERKKFAAKAVRDIMKTL